MMNKILFSSSVALASEIMNSLLAGTFFDWIDNRNSDFALPSDGRWDVDVLVRLKKRVATFSKSVADMRILEILPQPFYSDEDIMEDLRDIVFYLGNEQSGVMAKVQVTLMLTKPIERDFGDRNTWGLWDIHGNDGSPFCIEHLDISFVGDILEDESYFTG